MNLLNVKAEETNVNLPKFTETTFILRNNYYVVFNGEVYNYYPIKVKSEDESKPIIRLERSPPVILEGYALVSRKIYLVTVNDLQRKVIRKSREIQREVQNATDSNNTANNQSVSTLLDAGTATAVLTEDERRLIDATEVEVRKAADAAWEDQVRALLHDPDEEEGEWEIEDPA